MHTRHLAICSLPGCAIFFHIISHTARFSKKKKKLLNIKYVFRFYRQLLPEKSLILRRNEKDVIKSVFIQYNPTKCAFSKLIYLILIFWCLLHVSNPRVHLQEDGFMHG